MSPAVYYNDVEPFVCDWLENLIREKLLPEGVVDRRSSQEVEPKDVRDFTQCHFFAGIGGWVYALQLAEWGDRPVWTGSCPCQPFSAAGKGQAEDDPRHLWPHWFRLIRECQPERVFGEQVAAAVGHGWLDLVSADLEAEGYAVGAVVLGAHSVGAPHLRQRIWFVADSECDGRGSRGTERQGQRRRITPVGTSAASLVADRDGTRCGTGRAGQAGNGRNASREQLAGLRAAGELADTDGWDASAERQQRGGKYGQRTQDGGAGSMADAERGRREGPHVPVRPARQDETAAFERGDSPWDAVEWIPCRDGKARPVKPGLFPLAHGVPNRVGTLRGAGNAINPWTAAAFVSAYLDVVGASPAPQQEKPA